jgi:signal transduction histidine kinase/ActR/RegA family two-component response regulator
MDNLPPGPPPAEREATTPDAGGPRFLWRRRSASEPPQPAAPPGTPHYRWAGWPGPLTLLLGLALLGVMWAGIVLMIQEDRRRAEAEAHRGVGEVAGLVEAAVSRGIAAVDVRLRVAQRLFLRDPGGFAFGEWAGIGQDGTDLLGGAILRLEAPPGVGRITAEGAPALPVVDPLSHPMVRAHLERPAEDRLHIGLATAEAGGAEQPVLQLSRPVRDATGRLQGVAVFTLDAGRLVHVPPSLGQRGGSLTLLARDGMVSGTATAAPPLPAATFERLRAAGGEARFREVGASDGLERIGAARPVAGGDMLQVVVAQELQEALRPAEEHRTRLLLLGALLTNLVLLALWLLGQRRRREVEARAMLEAAVENLGQGVALFDRAGRLVLMNSRAKAMLGLPEALAVQGRRLVEIVDWQIGQGEFGDDPEERKLLRAAALKRRADWDTHARVRPDGRVIEVRKAALRDGGSLRTYNDITERRRAEAAVAAARDAAVAAEAALSAAIENLPQGIILIGPDRRLKVANGRFGALLGIPEELARPGRHVNDILAWQVEAGRLAADLASLEDLTVGGGAPPAPGRLDPVQDERRTPDGRVLEVRTVPLPDGGIVRSYTDISEHRRHEAALAEARDAAVAAEAALSAAISNVPQGIMLIDPEGRVQVLNRRAAEMLSLPPHLAQPGALVTDIIAWQRANGEFDQAPNVVRLIAEGQPTLGRNPVNYERLRPDGTVIDVRTVPLPDGGVVRTFTDVTERRRTERVLAEARDAAEAGARARTEFLAVVSHEIRTPLNAVIGLAGLLQEASLPAEQSSHARLIREAGDHLLTLINGILDFASLEAGKLALEEEAFDPRQETLGVQELLSPQARAKGLHLTVDCAPGVPARVRGDAGRLRQVLLNLVGNAVKFTETGSVHVALCRLPPAPGEAPEAVRLGFEVRDTGIGIPAAQQERLFSAFSQADSSTTRRFGGTGLGLAICRQLIERMGGRIRVDSAPGRGSVFAFEILVKAAEPSTDAAAAPAPALPAPAEPAPLAERALRILIAEDNATNRLVLSHRLRQLGHRVNAVGSGQEAVAAAQEGIYDLIVMDVMMPGMDGLAATRAIRALPGSAAEIPILGLTAAAMPEDAAACRAAGMDAYEHKPIRPDRLRAVIAAAISARAAPPDPS